MDLTPTDRAEDYRDRLLAFMAEHVLPADPSTTSSSAPRATRTSSRR